MDGVQEKAETLLPFPKTPNVGFVGSTTASRDLTESR
jgi:hypothetical protein